MENKSDKASLMFKSVSRRVGGFKEIEKLIAI